MGDEKNTTMETTEDRSRIRKTLEAVNTQYLYYVIIGVFTFVILVFLPMIGSSLTGQLMLPQGKGAWIVFVITRVFIAITNVIIFYSFMQQAKLNVRNNKYYKEANEILIQAKNMKEKEPQSPKKWERSQYLKKGTTIAFGTVFALFSLSQAVLAYDYISLISYSMTIFMAVVFGIIQMKKAEIYWTTEYYKYAMKIKAEEEKAEEAAKVPVYQHAEEVEVPATKTTEV